jgi:hypothetical protein
MTMNTLLQPDICVPENHRRVHHRRIPPQPEAALMLAVLQEAVDTFRKFAFSNSVRGKKFLSRSRQLDLRRTISGLFPSTIAQRLSTISYGEEVPVCREENEDCWQKNRHDRFVIKSSPTS